MVLEKENRESFVGQERFTDDEQNTYAETITVKEWRNFFRSRGWYSRENAPEEPSFETSDTALLKVPENVTEVLNKMSPYPSQLSACLEILDSLVSRPQGLRRYLSVAAGSGKSFVKKCLTKIVRGAGLAVKIVAVAAIVAQDDEEGEGSVV